jgi:hypothetical protein
VELPGRVLGVVIAVVTGCVVTIAILGRSVEWPELTPENLLLAVILIALIISADFFDIDAPLASARVTVSVSAALSFGAAITLGPLAGAVISGVSALTVEVIQRREVVKLIVNVTNYAFATFMGGFVYHSISDPLFSPIGSWQNAAALLLAASTYTVVDSGIISLVLSQVLETSPFQLWRANIRGVMFEHLTLPTLGALIPVLKEQSLLALIIVVIPLLGPYLAFRSYRQVHDETRQTLNTLADMLDLRDPMTAEHSQRVSSLVERMLEHLPDVSLDEAERIVTAARIHDLGKVATRDATLMKAGRLTRQERLEIERHTVVGFEILSNITIFREAARLVRHHHERWDGRGYPDGLAGEEIPLGSRLIAVADTYDAMTSKRVYREALPGSVAIAEITRNAGAQFDPQVVQAFLKVMEVEQPKQYAPVLQQVGRSE